MKKAISGIDFIATTTDCCSSRRRGFIGATGLMLTVWSSGSSVALACRQLKGPHASDVLACTLNDIHSEFGIQNKVVRSTMDNGSNFLKVFRIYMESKMRTTTLHQVRLTMMRPVTRCVRMRMVLRRTL